MITRRCMLAACGGLAVTTAIKSAAAQTPMQAVPARARNRTMEIKRIGSQPSGKGPGDYFTGTVRVDPLFQAPEPARGAGASVTFEPGARTAWHTHPLGQTLIVTAGVGWAQRWGEEIRPGDVRRDNAWEDCALLSGLRESCLPLEAGHQLSRLLPGGTSVRRTRGRSEPRRRLSPHRRCLPRSPPVIVNSRRKMAEARKAPDFFTFPGQGIGFHVFTPIRALVPLTKPASRSVLAAFYQSAEPHQIAFCRQSERRGCIQPPLVAEVKFTEWTSSARERA